MELQKGMSQTLALIIAASVLMMTALTVIFMVQGGLTDVGEGTSGSSCTETIKSKCATTNGLVSTPVSCHEDGQRAPGVPSWVPDSPDVQVDCETDLP